MPLAGDKYALGRWTNVRRLVKLIREHRISIIHTHVPSAAWLAKKAAQETGAVYTLTCHSLYPAETFAELRRNGVMAQAAQRWSRSRTRWPSIWRIRYPLPGGRPLVVTPGIDVLHFDPARVRGERMTQFSQQWRLPDGVPVVMLPGRLTRSRGHRHLIEALAGPRLARTALRLRGRGAGNPGYRKELLKLAQPARARFQTHHRR